MTGRELEEKTHAGFSSALVPCVSLTSAEQWWEMQWWEKPMVQHGQPVAMKIYTMWKGFDLETPNQLQIKGNVSLMHPYPRVKFSVWLSMTLTPLNDGKVFLLVHRSHCHRTLEMQVGPFAALLKQFVTRVRFRAAWQEAAPGWGLQGAEDGARPPPNDAPPASQLEKAQASVEPALTKINSFN